MTRPSVQPSISKVYLDERWRAPRRPHGSDVVVQRGV